MSSPLPIAGFAGIEAADLAEAIALVSKISLRHRPWRSGSLASSSNIDFGKTHVVL
jgi:hypothetical protein